MTAQRWRLTHTTTDPAVIPALQGTYLHDSGDRRQLLATDSSALGVDGYNPDAVDHAPDGNSLHVQFVSGNLGPGITYANLSNVKAALQASEATSGDNQFLVFTAAIFDSTGTTLRRLLFQDVRDNTELYFAGGTLNRFFGNGIQTGATYTTVDGDILSLEIGIGGDPGGGGGVQGHNGDIRWGGNGASGDLPENDTEAGSTFNPWFEFTVTIETGDFNVNPGLITQSASVFAPTLTPGGISVSPGLQSQPASQFNPSLTSNLDLTPDLVSQLAAVFAPTLTPGGVDVTPALLSQLASQFAPTLESNLDLTPDLISQLATLFAPTVSFGNLNLVPGLISQLASVFDPTLDIEGSGEVLPASISQPVTLFAPTLLSNLDVTPALITQSAGVFGPTVSFGNLDANPGLISQLAVLFQPTIEGGEEPPVGGEGNFFRLRRKRRMG